MTTFAFFALGFAGWCALLGLVVWRLGVTQPGAWRNIVRPDGTYPD